MEFKITKEQDIDANISYLESLRPLVNKGKIYNSETTQHREKRSIKQNDLMWLWIACISSETGQDQDSIHDCFKKKFLGFKEKIIFNERLESIATTTKLDTKQFTQYLNHIKVFASSELGIILPDRESQYWSQFYEQYKDYI